MSDLKHIGIHSFIHLFKENVYNTYHVKAEHVVYGIYNNPTLEKIDKVKNLFLKMLIK